jgi:hypothetical protein
VSATSPAVPTLLRSPERAAIAVLLVAGDVARNALLAAHPQLACEPTGDPLDRAVRRVLKRIDRLHAALALYLRADDNWEPSDDVPF